MKPTPWRLAVDTGGETVERTLDLPRPPVLRSTLAPLLAGLDRTPGTRTSLQLFDPLTQRDEAVDIEVVGPDTLVVLGEEVAMTHIRQHSRGLALDAWINARGELLRQELGLGLVAVRETEEEARFGLIQARTGRAGADLRALTAIPVAAAVKLTHARFADDAPADGGGSTEPDYGSLGNY